MDDRDSIVIESYPTEDLPWDLQRQGDFGGRVRLIIEAVPTHNEDQMPLTALLEEMQNERVLSDDPVKRVRALRAEWDWRDELHDRIRSGDAD